MEKMLIYTDGGCSGNPGPGGWGFVILFQDKRLTGSGAEQHTTNNKMELTAVIRALETAGTLLGQDPAVATEIAVFTDSQYVKNGISNWIYTWEKNGWKTASKDPVKNQDLWKELKMFTSRFRLSWNWVKGHAGDELNELCDTLVRAEIDRLRGVSQRAYPSTDTI